MYFPKEDSDTTGEDREENRAAGPPPDPELSQARPENCYSDPQRRCGHQGPGGDDVPVDPRQVPRDDAADGQRGVSRKMEDEDMRRQMRDILDSIDLPDGFGFILRTAGFGRTKTEIKRDLSYLQRLWKNIEKRQKTTTKPGLLYAESDLLVRALRDLLTSDFARSSSTTSKVLRGRRTFLRLSRRVRVPSFCSTTKPSRCFTRTGSRISTG